MPVRSDARCRFDNDARRFRISWMTDQRHVPLDAGVVGGVAIGGLAVGAVLRILDDDSVLLGNECRDGDRDAFVWRDDVEIRRRPGCAMCLVILRVWKI